MPAARLEIILQFSEPQRARVLRMPIAVEIENVRDVDAERLHQRNPGRLGVETA